MPSNCSRKMAFNSSMFNLDLQDNLLMNVQSADL